MSQQDSNKATRLLKEKESSVIPQVSNDNINKIKSMFKLVRIPAGSFTMGSRDGYPDEIPPHQVSISRPFWINKYEVTQEQYELVMGNNPSNFKSPQRPVEMVSWEDTVAFCKKVSELTGEKYRLPTEAEWEYACRGGSDTNYYWGSDRSQMPKHAWYGENSKIMTHDVGKKKPNNWGLYDMNGNVSEWCLDFYDKFYYSHGHAHDPLNEKGETFRVHRGGSWTSIRTMITSSERDSNTEYYHYYNLGFRVVKEIPRSSIPGKDDKILNSVTPD